VDVELDVELVQHPARSRRVVVGIHIFSRT
jgi:hypothetical protein